MSDALSCCELSIPGVMLLRPRRIEDARGWFCETYNPRDLAEVGIVDAFVQDNLSLSALAHTVRGLHFQAPPHAQAKLVSVMTGRILDAVVDIRMGSPTFGKSLTVELSASSGNQLYVPEGFLHGFLTLENDTRVSYKVSSPYNAAADGSVYWGDSNLGIDWGISAETAIVSEKDAAAPRWSTFQSPFAWGVE